MQSNSPNQPFQTVFSRSQQQAELDMCEALRFQLLSLRYAEVGDEWNTGEVPRCDGTHYVHFVCSGSAKIRWNEREMILHPNHAYWLPAHVPVTAVALGRYCHYFLAFRCAWHALSDIFWDWETPIRLARWPSKKYSQIWSQPMLSFGDLWRISTMLQQMFAEEFQPIDAIIRRANTLHTKFRRMFDLLDQAPDARIRVSDMAKAEFMTTNAFSRLFHAHFGTGPKNYLNQRLNQEICQLLLGTELPIKSIAEKLHFTDEYYFNRFFHRMNNISPARYRRRFLSSTTTIEIGNDH